MDSKMGEYTALLSSLQSWKIDEYTDRDNATTDLYSTIDQFTNQIADVVRLDKGDNQDEVDAEAITKVDKLIQEGE